MIDSKEELESWLKTIRWRQDSSYVLRDCVQKEMFKLIAEIDRLNEVMDYLKMPV